jgi:peptidoglycan/LPS O-acetylase OafA/YrhL
VEKLKSIEMLRAVAALLVVFFHTETIAGLHTAHVPFGGMFSGGSHGVDLFFVLSGFIIYHVHKDDLGKPQRLKNYIFNRVARIFPAVWIVSGFALLLYSAGYGGAAKAAKLSAYGIFASFTLFPQFGDALVNVSWSLKYELFFYAVFAALIIDRRAGFCLLLVWQVAALLVGAYVGVPRFGLLGLYLTSLSVEFGIGMASGWILARVKRERSPGFRSTAALWLCALAGTAMFVLGMAPTNEPNGPIGVTAYGRLANHAWSISPLCSLGAALLIVSLVLLERAGRIKVAGVLVFLGGASYSIYLVHFSVVSLLIRLVVRRGMPIDDPLCVGVAAIGIFVGIIFHVFIDKPIQGFLRGKLKPVLVGRRSA